MGILKKPYQITVWRDEWDSDQSKFVEKRVGIIGADNMVAQCRAIEPTLTRNVNGTKKFSFQMYTQYIDNETGEKTKNPFIDWLVSERKVKLQYDEKWYDFIIKDISENSATYLNTYSLEDALVQELSKNGFGVTLDAQLMNNMGTVQELAERVLVDTDWEVESETFVETIEESLVYLRIPNSAITAILLKDSGNNYLADGLTEETTTLQGNSDVLAFYSSCRNKPHRFQFIYLPNYDKQDVLIDSNRIILNKDCQYYIELSENEYADSSNKYGLSLPTGWNIVEQSDSVDDEHDTTISTWYRGARYGFAQKAEYVPLLNRYCQIYSDGTSELYGYTENKYTDPVFTTNLVSNTEFENTSGWIGTYFNADTDSTAVNDKAVVANVYGQFTNGTFVNCVDYMRGSNIQPDDFSSFLNGCKPYLKITLKGENSAVINSGPYDNRTLIGNMSVGKKYAFRAVYTKAKNDLSDLSFNISEYVYNTNNGGYEQKADTKISFSTTENNGYTIYEVVSGYENENEFKNSKLKIAITGAAGDYYIENLEFFEAAFDESNNVIPLDRQGESIDYEGIITTEYKYFTKTALQDATDVKDLSYSYTSNTSNPNYQPVYNTNGEKTRSVSAKESNYFNILQSIAETFTCWLDLLINRDTDGAIISKKVSFKNYFGKENYAAIRYGINLKDIQRTHASKNIVTKLMVKQNSNEFGENGFCTIQRAGSNPTGESYIYDFQYFQNVGLMSASDYIYSIYKVNRINENNPSLGPDIGLIFKDYTIYYSTNGSNWSTDRDVNSKYYRINDGDSLSLEDGYTIQGYALRLRAINDKLLYKNNIAINASSELRELNAKLTVANAKNSAAISGIEDSKEAYFALVQHYPEQVMGMSEDEKKDLDLSSAESYFQEYSLFLQQKNETEKEIIVLNFEIAEKKASYNALAQEITWLQESKNALNKLFYSNYSRFIQEGTWIDEQYYDDEKYYIDSLSVMYNSCYPQVAYTINTNEISQIEGYEDFKFELGDRTYVEDGEFFGYTNGVPNREKVIISEKSENLDDPTKSSNKVQNFKNQFQDLFQKITATTQQVQYSTGAYEKSVAQTEAIAKDTVSFLTEALDEMASVDLSDPVVESTSSDLASRLLVVDGKVLIGEVTNPETGDVQWKTGLSSKGISASLLTTGQVDTQAIQIMSGKDPLFRWDSKGISAYDHINTNKITTGINKSKFVRFDKNGLYGINGLADPDSWAPESPAEALEKATFGLTWEGLKVKSNDNSTLFIGNAAKSSATDTTIMKVCDSAGSETFSVGSDGTLMLTKAFWSASASPEQVLYSRIEIKEPEGGSNQTNYPNSSVDGWHQVLDTQNDKYFTKSTDGGRTWSKILLVQGMPGESGGSLEVQYQNATDISNLIETNWNPQVPAAEAGKKTFMRQKLSTESTWSSPIQISGEDGATPSIEIVTIDGEKYWKINGENTSIKAEGQDGETPEVKIENGKWFINGQSTGVDATGPAGKDGTDIEYVYYRSETQNDSLSAPSYIDGKLTEGWTQSPSGITSTNKYEYMSMRTKPAGTNTQWQPFSKPVIWSKWGEKGTDGDGVEYKYYLKNDNTKPTYSVNDSNWKDEPQGVSANNKFEFVATIATKHDSNGNATTDVSVALWSNYSSDGKDGASVRKIDTYVRNFPYHSTTTHSWTGVKAGGTTSFVDPGHEETWTTGDSYNNSHINVGDIAYLVGTVSDRFAANKVNQTITLYGEVTSVTASGVTMITTNVVWGGTQGSQGDVSTVQSTLDQYFIYWNSLNNGPNAPTGGSSISLSNYYSFNNSTKKYVSQSGWNWLDHPLDQIETTIEDAYYQPIWVIDVQKLEKDDTTTYTIIKKPYLYNVLNYGRHCTYAGETYIDGSTIIAGSITGDKIEANSLIVGENVLMGPNAQITWSNVTGTDDVATRTFATNAANTAASNAQGAAETFATNAANTAKAAAIEASASDASAKAAAAQANAIDASAKDATSKANAAQAAAATDATNKANTAQSKAEATAKTYADNAQDTAKAFATSEAGKAQAAAATDATNKANEAYSKAETFATNKANEAYNNAIDEITKRGYQTADAVTEITKNTVTTAYVDALHVQAASVTTDALRSLNYINSGGKEGTYLNMENGSLDCKNFSLKSNSLVFSSSGEFKIKDTDVIFMAAEEEKPYTINYGTFIEENNTYSYIINGRLSTDKAPTGNIYVAQKYTEFPEFTFKIQSGMNVDITEEISSVNGPATILSVDATNSTIEYESNFGNYDYYDSRITTPKEIEGFVFITGWTVSEVDGQYDSQIDVLLMFNPNNGHYYLKSAPGTDGYVTTFANTFTAKFKGECLISNTTKNLIGKLTVNSSKNSLDFTADETGEYTFNITYYASQGTFILSNGELNTQNLNVSQLVARDAHLKSLSADTINSTDIELFNGKIKFNDIGTIFISKKNFAIVHRGDLEPDGEGYALGSGNNSYREIRVRAINNPKNNENLSIMNTIVPGRKNMLDIGNSTNKWRTIYANTGTIQTSDENEKFNIKPLDQSYSTFFDKLQPVTYKLKVNESNRTHTGFGAQSVEKALIESGLTSKDFAGLCYWENEDGEKGYGLRYEEFIALNVQETQKLKQRVAELEEQVSKLTNLLQA